MAVAPPDTENRVVLRNVRWELYERFLEEFRDQVTPRLTFDRGSLEIMSPISRQHESDNRRLATLVEALSEEWGIEIDNCGSMTVKREDVERGFEPDSCFYIQNVQRVAGRMEIDLEGGDPPPDLIIEVDVTSPSLPRLPIYAAVGVPEVWRYQEGVATILALADGEYKERDRSVALPRLTSVALNGLMSQSRTLSRLTWLRAIRVWARQ